jgi:squalene synthase HpnC
VASPATGHPVSSPPFTASDVMSQAGSENFPVASRVLPRALRPHFLAVYGFARLVDDIGDEADGDRMAQLNWAEAELDRAAVGTAKHPVFVALAPTIARFDLPLDSFRALIAANRQDQTVTRYETFDDLVAYCMLSAAPVGRLVLSLLEAATPERVARSDRVCIGLQLVEHLQDVAEDARAGRIYLPLEDLALFGLPTEVLSEPVRRCATWWPTRFDGPGRCWPTAPRCRRRSACGPVWPSPRSAPEERPRSTPSSGPPATWWCTVAGRGRIAWPPGGWRRV